MWLFDLSLRHKLPIWGGLLIFLTSTTMFISFGIQAYDDLKNDMIKSLSAQGRSLVISLYPYLLHDNVWQAFEIVSASKRLTYQKKNMFESQVILVMDNRKEIFVASDPANYPIQTSLNKLDRPFAKMSTAIMAAQREEPIIMERQGTDVLIVGFPIIADDVVLGGVLMITDKGLFIPRLMELAQHSLLIMGFILAVLLPINWYWGRRMAVPLVSLSDHMQHIGDKMPPQIDHAVYDYRDEIGQIFKAFNVMIDQLEEKAYLETQILQSERMAAIGRLTASMAHEINNPLAGMLTAVDTLRKHDTELSPLTERTISLLDRGLRQIKDTVGTLLVEAKFKSRDLLEQDIEDVITLISPQLQKHHTKLHSDVVLPEGVPLPSTLIRQALINLLLNAVTAAGEQGAVELKIRTEQNHLHVSIKNDGKELPSEKMAYLYEPFNPLSDSGSGLGLWVTYQITKQLGGNIEARSTKNITTFSINIPYSNQL